MRLTSDPDSDIDAVTDRRTRYREGTARRVIAVYRELQQREDVVTITAIAKRSQVSRSTVRAVLRQECGWTPAQSRRAAELIALESDVVNSCRR